jgi:hypothetical protein
MACGDSYMGDEWQIDRKTHVETIDAAIKELMQLETRTKSPAPLAHQFIGTIVDNTVGLLTAPANALDGGQRSITFSDSQNWLSLMQAVHRYFFSSLHTGAEIALVTLCRERKIEVHSRLEQATNHPVRKIEEAAGDLPIVRRALKDLRAVMRTYRPSFDDYLEGALSTVTLNDKTKKTWRRFFRALSIIRNKTSHAEPALTDAERVRLREGGFAVMISGSGELVMNPRMYRQAAGFVLDFFDLLHSHNAPT